jgi:hypothetical protein
MIIAYTPYTIPDLKVDSYISPIFFDGVRERATMVYTNDTNIAKAYEAIGVEVRPIKKVKNEK